jgi:hypothetical protein
MTMTTTDNSAVVAFPSSATQPPTDGQRTGYGNVRFNALKHGVLSRHTVLSHEDGGEYGSLLDALVSEHLPSGPTETHLVEELAGVIWRKRRVLQAEGASINRGLLAVSKARHDRSMDPDGPARAALPFEPSMVDTRLNHPTELAEAIREAPEETRQRALEAAEELAGTSRAAEILRRGGARAYERALRALTPASVNDWASSLQAGEVAATEEELAKHIHEFLLPYHQQAVVEARGHDAIRDQTLGEGFQPHRLEKLNRYEVHLDRKFERTLAMLLKLKELRRGT